MYVNKITQRNDNKYQQATTKRSPIQVQNSKGLSYSNVVKSAGHDRKTMNEDANIFNFKNEIQKIFNMSLSQIMQRINEFLPRYLMLSDENEKLMSMLQFLITLRNINVK